MSISTHISKMCVIVRKFTGDQIGEWRQGNKHTYITWSQLPDYVLTKEKGIINKSEYYLQYVHKGTEEYTMFDIVFMDQYLEEEISNSGIEDVFKDMDLRPLFDKLPYYRINQDRYMKQSALIFVEQTYFFSNSYEYGPELDEVQNRIIGYMLEVGDENKKRVEFTPFELDPAPSS